MGVRIKKKMGEDLGIMRKELITESIEIVYDPTIPNGPKTNAHYFVDESIKR